MPQVVPVYFAPSYDTAWSANPGTLTALTSFAPLQLGAYGSIGNTLYLTAITGADVITAYMFRQVSGAVRLILGRVSNLDEYDASATRTNQGTGYNASTVDWNMAAWGNQIIAVNYLDAPQSSTGTTFGALAGSPPKARFIAANQNFVMLADTDDGVNQYSDQVWWSALRNPNSWTASIATQAGNDRLLDSPGPITALIAYNDTFIAFKDNAIFVGEYVGPPYVWSWRAVSRRIGCVGGKALKELDGKLYFLHTSGFYEFDGQSIRNIGLPVFQTFLVELGFVADGVHVLLGNGGSPAYARAVADDIEGIVWFCTPITTGAGAAIRGNALCYGYNARSQKWGRVQLAFSSANTDYSPPPVRASSADIQAFLVKTSARFLVVANATSGTTIQYIKYPAVTVGAGCGFTTGVIGSNDGSRTLSRVHHRTLAGTADDPNITVTATGYTSENKNKTNGSATGVINTEYDTADLRLNSRYSTVAYTWSIGTVVILAGLALEYAKGPTTTR